MSRVDVELLDTQHAARWRDLMPSQHTAFAGAEYAVIQEGTQAGGHRSHLLVLSTRDARLAYPLMLRPIAELGFPVAPDARFDASTPPFTGPVLHGTASAAERRELASGVAGALRDLGVVTEFAHLHPWRREGQRLLPPDDVRVDREMVFVDLTMTEETLWRESFTAACRKNVRRAERSGVRVRGAATRADVSQFHRIYSETMQRRNARHRYRYSESYFQAFHSLMPQNARFALAERDGEVLAATLFVHDQDDVYSFLGGADHRWQSLRPTNALINETITWARESGKKRLILGGGYRPGDGIMRFKCSFSRERVLLRLLRRTHQPDVYDRLVAGWRSTRAGASPDPTYFPLYRAEKNDVDDRQAPAGEGP